MRWEVTVLEIIVVEAFSGPGSGYGRVPARRWLPAAPLIIGFYFCQSFTHVSVFLSHIIQFFSLISCSIAKGVDHVAT